MRINGTALEPRDGVLILSGYGIRVSVHHGRLAVSDNLNGDPRSAELSRATCGLRRLVVLGHTGFVTLDALRWITDIGAAFVQIDADGKLIACYAPQGINDVHRRRMQALCAQTPQGMRLVRPLLEAKLRGQAAVLRSRADVSAAERVEGFIPGLVSDSPEDVRFVESRAAEVYWRALAITPVRFAHRDAGRIPAHWRTLGSRKSLLGSAPRNAVNPANALWNLLYSVIAAEIRIALIAEGLDPEMGLMHSLHRFRDALAHDLIEPLRPLADRWLLALLEQRVFSARDFVETRQGVVRLVPPLPQAIVTTAPAWLERARPLAVWIATALNSVSDESPKRPARLKVLPALAAVSERLPLMPRCRSCGKELREYRQKDCADCAAARRDLSIPQVVAASLAARALARSSGSDSTHTRQAAARRSRANARSHAEARPWRRSRSQILEDREAFRALVLPGLASIGVAELARLTGLSKAQCSLVRRGLRTLHPRHWPSVTRQVDARKAT